LLAGCRHIDSSPANEAAKFKTRFARFSGYEFYKKTAARTDGECAAIIINLKRGALRDLTKYMENFTANLKRSLTELIWRIKMRLAAVSAVNLLCGCS
jgi:hypothetical protein